jgi:hypothetical protein
LQLPVPCKRLDVNEVMVAYVTGSSSKEKREEFEAHCLSCEECLAMLAIILRAKASEQIRQCGVEAARIAREKGKQKARLKSKANDLLISKQSLQFR